MASGDHPREPQSAQDSVPAASSIIDIHNRDGINYDLSGTPSALTAGHFISAAQGVLVRRQADPTQKRFLDQLDQFAQELESKLTALPSPRTDESVLSITKAVAQGFAQQGFALLSETSKPPPDLDDVWKQIASIPFSNIEVSLDINNIQELNLLPGIDLEPPVIETLAYDLIRPGSGDRQFIEHCRDPGYIHNITLVAAVALETNETYGDFFVSEPSKKNKPGKHAEELLLCNYIHRKTIADITSICLTLSPCTGCTFRLAFSFLCCEIKPTIKYINVHGKPGTTTNIYALENIRFLQDQGFNLVHWDPFDLIDLLKSKAPTPDDKRNLEICEQLYRRRIEEYRSSLIQISPIQILPV